MQATYPIMTELCMVVYYIMVPYHTMQYQHIHYEDWRNIFMKILLLLLRIKSINQYQ